MAAWVLYGLLAVCLGVSLVTDLRSRKIYNVVTLPTLALALLVRLALGGWDGPFGLAQGLGGAAVGLGVFLALALAGGMGMGDVKLVGAVGAILGWDRMLPCLLLISVAGGLQGLASMLWSGTLWETLRRRGKPKYVPYGVAIVAGTVWTVLWRPWFGP